MFSMASSSSVEGDVNEVVNEREGSNLREPDDAKFPQEMPSLSRVVDGGILRNSPAEKAFKARLNIDLDADVSRNGKIAVEGGPRKSFAVDVDSDPLKHWTLAVEGCPRRSFAVEPLDSTDVLARKSVSLEGLWRAEAESRRSFSYEGKAPRRSSRSVELPFGRSTDGSKWNRANEGSWWKSRSTGFSFLAAPNDRDNCLSLEIAQLNVLPPLEESTDETPKLLTTLPVSIKFTNIVYRVSTECKSSWMDVKSWGQKLRRRTQEKIILNGISGAVYPGEMLGILGPSGSGKTTLVQILAGRIVKYDGRIAHNDIPFVKAMNRRTGFLSQDDVLYPHLTVKETLICAALLKLPREFSRQAKMQRAQDVVLELGLDRCRDTIVGSSHVRGVSGGERKRVSIGCEILTDPSLLLLDEPISGLDSTTALSIVRILLNLAHGGKTILSTMHQPSSVIYHMLDKILLLSDGGDPLFYGMGTKALGYFECIGYHPTFSTNPADFLVDLANGVTHDLEDLNKEASPFVLSEHRAKEQVDERNHVKKILKDAYDAHVLQESKYDIRESKPGTVKDVQIIQDTVEKREWSTSWAEQFIILSHRALKERRYENFSAPRVLETLMVAIVAALIWWDSSDKIEDQVGLLFFSTMVWAYFPLYSSIYAFPMERDMVKKERASGMYRLSAYFLAQSIVDVPMELILPTVYIIIVYWIVGLKHVAVAFLATWGALLLNVLVAQGLGLAIGAICMNLKKASHLASSLMLAILMVGGFFSKDIFPSLRWLKYTSFCYHAFKLELNAQYGPDDVYTCGAGQCRVADLKAVSAVGLGGRLSSVLAMFALLVSFRLVAYIALRRTKVSI